MFYALVFGIFNFLPSKHLKNRTQTGLEAVSGPGPVRFGPGPENFSPVRSGTPATLPDGMVKFMMCLVSINIEIIIIQTCIVKHTKNILIFNMIAIKYKVLSTIIHGEGPSQFY